MPDATDLDASGDRGVITPRSMALAIYGTIAAGLALAIETNTDLSTAAVIVSVFAQLVGFFLAHAYADMLGEHFSRPGTRMWERFGHACSRDFLLLVGGLPIVVLFLVEIAVGISPNLGVTIALALLIVLLAVFGAIAARRARASWPAAVGEGVLAAVLGSLVLVLKLLLH